MVGLSSSAMLRKAISALVGLSRRRVVADPDGGVGCWLREAGRGLSSMDWLWYIAMKSSWVNS
jgi:hypothetical protein